MSDGSQVGLYYARENSFGAGAPAATAFKALRFTSESLKQNITFEESDEISADRSTKDVIRTSLSAIGAIGIEWSYATYDDFLAAAIGGTWLSDTLINASQKPSFILEKHFADIDVFHQYTGLMVDTLSMDIPSNGKITGSISFIGLNEYSSDDTAAAMTTPVEAATFEIMNSVENVSGVYEGGIPFAGCIDRIALSTNNNVRARHCVGSATATAQGLGKLQISGVFRAHYSSRELYEKKLDQTASALAWSMVDSAGNRYDITLPNIRYTEGQVITAGNNSDVIADLGFTALLHPGLGYMIRIVRDAAGGPTELSLYASTAAVYASNATLYASSLTYTP